MLALVILVICLFVILIKWLTIKREYWVKRNTKQVSDLLWTSIIGNQFLAKIVKDIYDDNSELPYVGTYFGMKPALILRDLKNIQAVLHGDFQSFYARGIHSNSTDVLCDNLFFIDDYKRWKLIRHKMASVLRTKNVKHMFNITERCARDFLDYIMEYPETKDDPYKVVYLYIIACITSAVFGVDMNTPKNILQTPYSKIGHTISKPSHLFNLKFTISHIAPKLHKLLNLKVFDDLEPLFIQCIKEVIYKRSTNEQIGYHFMQEFLYVQDSNVLIDSVTGYDITVSLPFIAAQAVGFFVGGVDTSSTVFHLTLSELAWNSLILQKVHDEIDEIFKRNQCELTIEDIDNLIYMEKVLNETLRKYPPVSAIQRKCCKDTVLPIGNLKVEKDTIVIIPTLALHYDKKYFPNPEVFDPERFSAENISKIVKFTNLSFGDGKRNCIGQRLAFMQLKVGLAWLLRKYTVVERPHTTKRFDPNIFILRDPTAHYRIIPRVK